MTEYIVELPLGGAGDECIRLRGYEKRLYGYELREEVVRCRDCQYFDTEWSSKKHPGEHFCYECDKYRKENDFCSLGERRDNGDS